MDVKKALKAYIWNENCHSTTDEGVESMGGKGSGRKPGFKGEGVPKDKNPMKQAADPSNVVRGTNSAVMAFGADIMAFDPPDFGDAESLRQRFYDYLELCSRHGIRPMVTSMANAFGLDRRELWGIAVGDAKYRNWHGGILTPECRDVIKKAYTFLNTAWEAYLMEESKNPVKWLFLGKNYFGMKDQTEQVQVRMDVAPRLSDPEAVAKKYAAMVGRPRPALADAEIVDIEDA